MQIRQVVVGKSRSGELATAFQLAASGPIGQSSPWCYGNTIPCHTIRYHTIHYYTMPYHDILYHTILYICIPYHIIPYNIHCILYTTQATLLSSYSKARQVLSAHFQMPQAAQLTDPLRHRPQISVSQIGMMQKWRRNQAQRLCSPWTLYFYLMKMSYIYVCEIVKWAKEMHWPVFSAHLSALASLETPRATQLTDPCCRLEPSISGSPTCQKLNLSSANIVQIFSLLRKYRSGCLLPRWLSISWEVGGTSRRPTVGVATSEIWGASHTVRPAGSLLSRLWTLLFSSCSTLLTLLLLLLLRWLKANKEKRFLVRSYQAPLLQQQHLRCDFL